MQDALTNLLGWITDVLQVFQSIKWKPIGIETIEGTPVDRSRGVYEMRNPNAEIDNVLAKYKHEVMDNLHLILSRLEPMLETNGGGGGGGGAAAVDPAPGTGMDDVDDPLGGLPPPAPFGRQMSSAYIDDSPASASRHVSNLPFAEVSFHGDTQEFEKSVHYVIAKVFIHNDMKIGFPAFDQAKNLVGFYRETVEGSHTEVDFIPLAVVTKSIQLTKENMRKGSESLERELKRGSQSVHEISRHGNRLSQMKEAALMYYWAKNEANATEADVFTDLRDFFEL